MTTVMVPDQRIRAPRRQEDTRATSEILPEDWRPADHEFSDEEIRDRLMRYGGMDAATAWQVVEFVRNRRTDVDWDRLITAGRLTFGAVE